MHALLRRGSTTDKDEAEYLRCILIRKGDYISAQPLAIGDLARKLKKKYHQGNSKG
jgi:hypothetical protein